MTKEEFMAKYDLIEEDYDALIDFEIVRRSGFMNMFQYLGMMRRGEVKGNKELSYKITKSDIYSDFLNSLDDYLNDYIDNYFDGKGGNE